MGHLPMAATMTGAMVMTMHPQSAPTATTAITLMHALLMDITARNGFMAASF